MNLNSNPDGYVDPTVAEFLQRHGIDKNDGMDVLDTIVQLDSDKEDTDTKSVVERIGQVPRNTGVPPKATITPQPTAPQSAEPSQPAAGENRRDSVDTMRELRSVANAISVSISRSNLLREKLKEATRFLALGFVCGLVALILALGTNSVRSFVFFSALLSLVLGLISTYRSTMIMTKLNRIAKI